MVLKYFKDSNISTIYYNAERMCCFTPRINTHIVSNIQETTQGTI